MEDKFKWIKEYRTKTGCGLRESIDAYKDLFGEVNRPVGKVEWISNYRRDTGYGFKESLEAYHRHIGLHRIKISFTAYNSDQVLKLVSDLEKMPGVEITERYSID